GRWPGDTRVSSAPLAARLRPCYPGALPAEWAPARRAAGRAACGTVTCRGATAPTAALYRVVTVLRAGEDTPHRAPAAVTKPSRSRAVGRLGRGGGTRRARRPCCPYGERVVGSPSKCASCLGGPFRGRGGRGGARTGRGWGRWCPHPPAHCPRGGGDC